MSERAARSPRRAALAVALVLAACSGDRGWNPARDGGFVDERPCADDCESNLWPRIVVGVVSAGGGAGGGGAAPEARVRVRVRDERGVTLDGHLHGCPAAPAIVCSYSFFTTPRDRSVVVRVEPVGGEAPVEARLPLGRFNTCGREIAYVVVTLAPGAPPHIGPASLVSPCGRAAPP